MNKENNNEFSSVQELIALKKYETPGDHYFEGFVDQFHRKLRQDELMGRSDANFFDQLKDFFSGNAWSRLMIGGGIAYAAVALMLSGFAEQDGTAKGPIPDDAGANNVRAVNFESERAINFADKDQEVPQTNRLQNNRLEF